MDALISILAGLGLVFIGVKGISANTGQMTGRSLRRWVVRSVGNPVLGAMLGVLSGALTQSTNAVTVILISLARAEVITIAEATPILAWSNIGTAGLVIAAAVDIRLFVLLLLSAAGICSYLNFDRSPRLRPIVSTLVAVALLFLGLELMHTGAGELRQVAWVVGLIQAAAQAPLTSVLAGLVFALIVQSSATATVIIIAMVSAGLVTVPHGADVVLGASIGSGFSTALVGLKITGRPRQLAIFQTFFKISGVLLLLVLALAGRGFGIEWPRLVTAAGVNDPRQAIALVYLTCQIAAALAQVLFSRRLQPVLDRLLPPSDEETLSKPRYLYPDAISEPETALALVDKEQSRVFALLPHYLDASEAPDGAAARLRPDAILAVAVALGRTIGQFLDDLTDSDASRDLLHRLAERRGSNVLLMTLHESMDELAKALAAPFEAEAMQTLAATITEGLAALLFTAADAVHSRDSDDVAVLRELTSDRSTLVDGLRRRVMATDHALSAAEQARLYGLTSLLERIVWTLRHYAGVLTDEVEGQQATDIPVARAADPATASRHATAD